MDNGYRYRVSCEASCCGSTFFAWINQCLIGSLWQQLGVGVCVYVCVCVCIV